MRAVIIRESGALPSMAQLLSGHSFRLLPVLWCNSSPIARKNCWHCSFLQTTGYVECGRFWIWSEQATQYKEWLFLKDTWYNSHRCIIRPGYAAAARPCFQFFSSGHSCVTTVVKETSVKVLTGHLEL